MSTDNLHDDAEFERFLAGEGELSAQLKGLPQAEPSADLDAAVFASIEAAMAAEKVQQVEAEPRPAANDPVGPATTSPQRRRSLAYYWHWPVGVAAGILLTLAYRTAFNPYQPPAVALNDSMQSRVIAPVPRVTAQPDVITEPGKVATAPAIIEPPDVASQPVPPAAAAPAPPMIAAASVRDGAVPAGALEKRRQTDTYTVVVTGSQIRRADAATPSPAQVITADDLSASPVINVTGARESASGVELAWTRDPARDMAESKAARSAKSSASLGVEAPLPAQDVASARPEASVSGGIPAAAVPPPPPASAPAPVTLARAEPAASGFSSPNYGIIDQPSLGYQAPAPNVALRASSPVGGEFGPTFARESSPSPDAMGGNNGSSPQTMGKIIADPQVEATQHEDARPDPRKWLALIEQDIHDRQDQAALAEWDKFVAAHPAYKVKNKLRAAIKALRDRQQSQPASSK